MSDHTKDHRHHIPLIALFSLLFLFAFQLLVDFVEGIYAFGLAGTSIPPEIIAVLLFFSPLLMLLFRKGLPAPLLVILGVLFSLCRAVEVMLPTRGRMLVAGVGVACFFILFPSLIWSQSRQQRNPGALTLVISLSLAVSMAVMVRVVNSSLDFTTDGNFRWVGWLLTLLLVVLMFRLFPSTVPGRTTDEVKSNSNFGKVMQLSLGIMGTFLMLYFVFNSPNVIERWTDRNYLLIVAVIAAALSVFTALLVYRPSWLMELPRMVVWVWNLIFVIALVGTIYMNQMEFPMEAGAYPLYAPDVPGWSMLLLITALILFPVILLDFMLFYQELVSVQPTYRQLGSGFTVAAFFVLVMVLSHVFTTVYDYIPVIGPLFRDKFWLVYLVVGVVMVIPLVSVRNIASGADHEPRSESLPSAGFILVISLAIITVLAALLYNPQPDEVAGGVSSLKILTYNIQQAYSDDGMKNFDGQLDLIREIDADIIGLQESDTNRIANGNADVVRFFAERLDMYTYFGPKTVTGTFGDTLLSKYPIENPRTFYMYSEGEQTATIEAQITVDGRVFNVYVTHLGNRGPMVQQEQILEVVDGKENVILIGDFNFRPYEDQYALTTETLEDAWIVRWSGGNPDQGIDPMERIDHTFLTPGTAVLDSEHIPDPASDHPAMWTVIGW